MTQMYDGARDFTTPMKPEIKKAWVEALRSGKYKQGTQNLRNNDNSFCCLGVLCDLYIEQNPQLQLLKWEKFGTVAWSFDDMTGVLPMRVQQWAGLDGCDPVVKVRESSTSLAVLNDNGYTFSEIARLVEENL